MHITEIGEWLYLGTEGANFFRVRASQTPKAHLPRTALDARGFLRRHDDIERLIGLANYALP
jgi:methyl coenzyme M reductase subunit C-like uncharacterized protein (methanogenesis marker protein 7)